MDASKHRSKKGGTTALQHESILRPPRGKDHLMRACVTCLVLAAVCLGCNQADEARRRAAKNNLKQVEEALKAYHGTHGSQWSHVVAVESEYYTYGPQQGRPPDGKFPAGTKVSLLTEAGSYVSVRSESGIEAYVAADVVKQQESPAIDVSELVEGSNHFALDLYQQLRTEPGNLFFFAQQHRDCFGHDLRRGRRRNQRGDGENFAFPGSRRPASRRNARPASELGNV